MKICPVCSREYSSERTHCVDDSVALVALSTGANARAEDLIGQTVDGRYRIERVIGRGGMGTVYLCRHVVVGKVAAMKVLRPTVERSEGVLQRFIREAQTANAIRSRHIVEMTDFGQLPNGSFYVVMELLEGTDLTRAMRSGSLALSDLFHVFIQVADTLELAHGQGIVHRDLKPDNVFLVEEASDPLFVKLLDFGIAKILHTSTSGLTETGVILGTPYYMSPEQARAEKVDHRSDIYALGVMMYRAFTGRLPFIADSTMGVLTRHLTEEPELPSRLAEVDPALEGIILRCLAKQRENRFQSMVEVADALRQLAGMPRRSLTNEASANHDQGSPPSWVPGFTPSGGFPAAPGGPLGASGRHPALASGAHPAARTGSQPVIGSGPYPALSSGSHPAAASGQVPSGSGPYPPASSGPYPAAGSGPYPPAGSGPYPAAGSGPYSPAGSGPYPPASSGPHPAAQSGALPPHPPVGHPPLVGEGTQQSLVMSETGRMRAMPRRGLVIVSGAALAAVVGAVIAIGVFGTRHAEPTAASSGAAAASAASSQVSVEEPGPTAAEPVIPPSPPPTATAEATAAASASATGASRVHPPTIRNPPPLAPPPPPPPTSTRKSEIRSPFE